LHKTHDYAEVTRVTQQKNPVPVQDERRCISNFLKELHSRVLEQMLEGEMDYQLG